MEATLKNQSEGSQVCGDCGASLPLSSFRTVQCQACGNIELTNDKLGISSHPKPTLTFEFQTLTRESKFDHDQSLAVKEILEANQTEWELWLAVCNNFERPEFHSAYLSYCTLGGRLNLASDRYTKHQRIFVVDPQENWQAVVCDDALEKINRLTEIQMRQRIGHSRKLAGAVEYLYLNSTLLYQSKSYKMGWIFIGFLLIWLLTHF